MTQEKHTPGPYIIAPPGGPAGPFWGIVNYAGTVVAMQIINEADALAIVAGLAHVNTPWPKADWSQAPEGAEWWSVDAGGNIEWHEVEPIVEQSVWLWPMPSNNERSPMMWHSGCIDIPLGCDWRLLKERRPEQTP